MRAQAAGNAEWLAWDWQKADYQLPAQPWLRAKSSALNGAGVCFAKWSTRRLFSEGVCCSTGVLSIPTVFHVLCIFFWVLVESLAVFDVDP